MAFLTSTSSAHSSRTGVAAHVDGASGRRDVDRDGVGERRDARAEIGRDAVDELGDVHRVAPRLASDALEAVRDAIEALEIGAHVARRPCASPRRGARSSSSSIQPARLESGVPS